MPYKKTTQIFCPLIEQITNRTNDQREDFFFGRFFHIRIANGFNGLTLYRHSLG